MLRFYTMNIITEIPRCPKAPIQRMSVEKAEPTGAPMTTERAASLVNQHFDLLDTAAGIGGKDGLVGKADLEAIIRNSGAPQDLKEAAQFLLNNPASLNRLDVAAGKGNVDGLIGRNDMQAFAFQENVRSMWEKFQGIR